MKNYDYDYDAASLVMADKAGYYVCAALAIAMALLGVSHHLGLLGVV